MKKLLIVFSFFTLLSASAFGQYEQTVAKVKVAFIYNFTRLVDWPPDYKQGDFVIGVLNGSPALLTELNSLAQKKIGNQQIIIKNFRSVDELNKCNILFIPESSNNMLAEALKKIHGSSTLLITESDGDAKKGAAINFIVKDNKQAFELNKANAEKNHLTVSSSLKTLAATYFEQ